MSRPTPAWTPPMRDGVSASRVAMAAGQGDTVAAFLATRLPRVADWPQRLARGEVLDAQGQPVHAHSPCRPGQLLWYWRAVPHEHPVPGELTVLHQDEQLVAVDKPHFMAAVPSGAHVQQTALVQLKQRLGIATLAPMHRLDRETAGVMLFTVQPAHRHAYHALLRDRQVHKVYEAVAPWRDDLAFPLDAAHRLEEPLKETPGRPKFPCPPRGAGWAQPGPGGAQQSPEHQGFMQIRVLPGEPNAHTRIELIGRLTPELAHYRLLPRTGRRHQLRAQMNALGLPLAGDRIYPRLWPQQDPDPACPPDFSQPLQLLAREIAFTDPVTGQPRRFVSQRQLALATG